MKAIKTDVIMRYKIILTKRILKYANEKNLTQTKLAACLFTTQARVSSLYRYKLEKYSLEKIIEFCYRLGIKIHVEVK